MPKSTPARRRRSAATPRLPIFESMAGTATRRSWGLVAILSFLSLAGCGSGGQSVTIPNPNPHRALSPAAPSTETTASPAVTTNSMYPVVHFTLKGEGMAEDGAWPFTAQLATMKENPNGFPGGGVAPPPGHTVLMVQVNITSQTTGRTVPVPRPTIVCHDPRNQVGESGLYGYDEGPEIAPEQDGAHIAFGDGQPHPWDAEWEVPENLNIGTVTCVMELEIGVNHETFALN
jgi:hypothetical protein